MTKQSVSTPKVAIITRTKNRPQFLGRSVKSVLNQTVNDYVHVILNDGGDKAEVERVLASNPDTRRIVIHNTESVGLSSALNQAIRASNSEYVCILDDDDAWHKDRLKIGLETTQQRDAVATVIPMEIVVEDIDATGSIVEVERIPHPESWCGEVSLFKQAHKNYLSNGAIMYKRSVYDELGGYDEALPTAEDWDFGIRLMLKYNVEQVLSDKALMYYHQRPDLKDGDIGNSVHAGIREQERAIMLLRNNYLRHDIQNGSFGIGYIMNHTEQENVDIVRIESHINRANEQTEDRIVDRIHRDMRNFFNGRSIYQKIKRKIKHDTK
jgi:Glycosyltransferases, probably involved in cell wall biogenesis